MGAFTKSRAVAGEYWRQRVRPLSWGALALLLYLLVADVAAPAATWARDLLFLWVSFLVFRLVDDVGSVRLDRIDHPERTYLDPARYPLLLRLCLLVSGLYLAGSACYAPGVSVALAALLGVSAGCYLAWGRSRRLLPGVPLLKYPVLLACVSDAGASATALGGAASFLLLALHDLFDSELDRSARCFLAGAGLLLCGLLVFQPWVAGGRLRGLRLGALLAPLALLAFSERRRVARTFPLLYFPLVSLATR